MPRIKSVLQGANPPPPAPTSSKSGQWQDMPDTSREDTLTALPQTLGLRLKRKRGAGRRGTSGSSHPSFSSTISQKESFSSAAQMWNSDSSVTPPSSLALRCPPLSLLQTPRKFLTNPSHPPSTVLVDSSYQHKADSVPFPRSSFSVFKPPFSLGPKLSFLEPSPIYTLLS